MLCTCAVGLQAACVRISVGVWRAMAAPRAKRETMECPYCEVYLELVKIDATLDTVQQSLVDAEAGRAQVLQRLDGVETTLRSLMVVVSDVLKLLGSSPLAKRARMA